MKKELLIGLSHVQLLFFEYVPKRIYKYNPDAKLIVTLRNPIDRAYSAYWYAKRRGREKAKTFEEALRNEALGKWTTYRDRADFTYLEHGHYYDQIQRYIELFGSERIYIILVEDLRNGSDYWQGLLNWLGVDHTYEPPLLETKFNESASPRSMWLHRILTESKLKSFYKKIFPSRLRYFVMRNITDKIISINLLPFEYPAMQSPTRRKLRNYFAPLNADLSKLINRDLTHWK